MINAFHLFLPDAVRLSFIFDNGNIGVHLETITRICCRVINLHGSRLFCVCNRQAADSVFFIDSTAS